MIGKDNMELAQVDFGNFVKGIDGLSYNSEEKAIELTIIQADGTPSTYSIDVAELVNIYTAGNGIDITGNAVSVKIDSSSEYLTAGESGLKVSGINSAIESAISAHSTTADGKYATKDELKTTDDKAASNATAIENLTGRIDDIVAEGGEPNQINNIKVNSVVQPIAEDKSVNITVPTKVSDLTDDTGFDGRITAAQSAADAAQGTANAASEAATKAQGEVDALETVVGGIQTTVTGHGTTLTDYGTRIGALE
jgi:hypothetical protein